MGSSTGSGPSPGDIAPAFSWATGKRALAGLVVFLVAATILFQLGPYAAVKDAAGGAALPEERLTSKAELSAFLERLDPSARDAYAAFQLWDLLNLLLFGSAVTLLTAWLVNVSRVRALPPQLLLTPPVLVAALDLAENVVLGLAVRSFPEASAIDEALPWVTGAKFASLFLTALTITTLGLVAGARKLFGKKRSSVRRRFPWRRG